MGRRAVGMGFIEVRVREKKESDEELEKTYLTREGEEGGSAKVGRFG
jgi:hypothetical protein